MKTISILFFLTFLFASSNIAFSQEFYFCDEVDDNWNPVGASDTKTAGGINFLTKLNQKVFNTMYMWVIYKIDENGNDTDFVNEYVMRIEDDIEKTGARFFCTTQKINFEPGKYRVYFIYEADKETLIKNGNLTKYLSKGTVTIN